MSSLKDITTSELLLEIEKRKQEEVPKLIKNIQDSIEQLSKFGVNLINSDDYSIQLGSIEFDEDLKGVIYTEKYV